VRAGVKKGGTTWTGLLTFVSVTLGIALVLVVSRRPPLTVDEVLKNGGQLAELAARTSVDAPGSEAAVTVTYTFDGACGDLVGVAVLNQWTRDNQPGPPESQLWFSLLVRERRWLRNPRRPALPAVHLVRQDATSDLVVPAGGGQGGPGAMTVTLHPAGTSSATVPPAALAVNNLRGAGARSSDQARHWGLAGHAASVHCKLGPRDLELFVLLARIARVRICDDPDAAGSRCYDGSLTLYRAAPEGRYWLEVRGLGRELGMLAYLLEVGYNRGALWRGEVRVIHQRTDLERAADLFFIHPREPGALLTPADPGFRAVPYRPGRRPGPAVEIDFQALLADTAWGKNGDRLFFRESSP
jgi:hypothetical protein